MKNNAHRKNKRSRKKKSKKLCHLKRIHLKDKISKHAEGKHMRLTRTPINHVTIFESELKFMDAMVNEWDNLETGGELYGSFSHEGRLTIAFAGPPAKEAIHQSTMFRQDHIFFKRASLLLYKHFSLNFVGNFHSHHYLPIKTLSGIDIRNLNKIARKNNFNRLTQFLITFENPSNTVNSYSNYKNGVENPRRLTKIKAFVYADAMNGRPLECQIKVIPGVSPIRKAIEENSDLKSELIIPYKKTKSQILYNKYNIIPLKNHRNVPPAIQTQVEPFLGKKKLSGTYKIDDDWVVLQISLFENFGFLFIIYDIHAPHIILSIFYKIDEISKDLVNISDDILINKLAKNNLEYAYRLCKRLIIKHLSQRNNLNQQNTVLNQSRRLSLNGKTLYDSGEGQ